MLVEQLKVSDEASQSNESSIDDDKLEDVNAKYKQFSKVELISLCRDRRLQKTGNMKTLRERLESHDRVKKLVESESEQFIPKESCDGCKDASFLVDVDPPAVWTH